MIRGAFLTALALLLPLAAPARDWTHYAADARSSKYSPLEQIDAENFHKLRVIWRWRPPDRSVLQHHATVQDNRYRSTPIVIDGVLYASSPLGIVTALDAATGVVLWNFDPESWRVPGWYPSMHRGVAYWRADDRARVVFGTNSAYLYSLDAATGTPDPAFGDGGRVDLTLGLDRPVDRSQYGFISPPIIVGDVIVVGSSIADIDARDTPPGDVRGFDKHTGEQLWTFHTIPRAGEPGVETWADSSWQQQGGANVWSMMSADEELGYVYLPVSTPSGDFYGGDRPGDNLYADSIVCLDAATGERVWHFQLIHHGIFDYDPPAAPVLLDLPRADGSVRKIVVQVTKQAFAYVFDRVNGEPIWPIVEMPVPPSTVPGEQSAPTQPVPSWPKPFDLQGLRPDDLIDFTPALRAEALELAAAHDFGPLFTPPSERGTIMIPGLLGGADWAGAVANPRTGMLYVPSHTIPFLLYLQKSERGFRSRRSSVPGPQGLPLTRPPYGRITAIDMHSGEHRWMQAVGRGPVDHPALSSLQLEDLGWNTRIFAFATPTLLISASDDPRTFEMVNAGDSYFVDPEPVLRAWTLDTGMPVGEVALPGNAVAGPITYEAGARQFIVVPLGDGVERPTELAALALPQPDDALPPQGDDREDASHEAYYEALRVLDVGDLEALDALLARHRSLVHAKGFLDSFYMYPALRGTSLLHHTIGHPRAALPANSLALTRVLLDHGADPDAINHYGLTALEMAVDAAQLDWTGRRDSLVSLLLDHGASPNLHRGKMLWSAVVDRDTVLAHLLVERGAEIDLRLAAGLGLLDHVKAFFDAAGQPTEAANRLYRSRSDTTLTAQQVVDEALNFAAYGGHHKTADFLLEMGADPNGMAGGWWSWDTNSTALHKAVMAGKPNMMRFLVLRGADPMAIDVGWQQTPYQWSMYTDNAEVQALARELEQSHQAQPEE